MLCMMNHILISKHYSIIALIETLRIPSVFFRYCQPIMYIPGLAAAEVRCFWICDDIGPFGVDMWNRRSGGQSILA